MAEEERGNLDKCQYNCFTCLFVKHILIKRMNYYPAIIEHDYNETSCAVRAF
jgi:hypothetical protein